MKATPHFNLWRLLVRLVVISNLHTFHIPFWICVSKLSHGPITGLYCPREHQPRTLLRPRLTVRRKYTPQGDRFLICQHIMKALDSKSDDEIPNGQRPSWKDHFLQLNHYYNEHGHTCVPKRDGSLGAWVSRQRLRKQRLDTKRVGQLDSRSINFHWNVFSAFLYPRHQQQRGWGKQLDEIEKRCPDPTLHPDSSLESS